MSNHPHQRPGGEVPAELRERVALMNSWQGAYGLVRPGPNQHLAVVVPATHDGKTELAVQLWTITTNGVHVAHLPPAVAEELAALLIDKAREARGGVEAVRSPLHLPNGNGEHP